MTTIRAITAQKISQDFLEQLLKAFNPKRIKDNDTLQSIYRQEGQRDVIEYIKAHVSKTTIHGDPDRIEDKQYSATRKRDEK